LHLHWLAASLPRIVLFKYYSCAADSFHWGMSAWRECLTSFYRSINSDALRSVQGWDSVEECRLVCIRLCELNSGKVSVITKYIYPWLSLYICIWVCIYIYLRILFLTIICIDIQLVHFFVRFRRVCLCLRGRGA